MLLARHFVNGLKVLKSVSLWTVISARYSNTSSPFGS